ncbi:hypothetical protein Tco_1473843 [Tanacetum coccineum]
MGLFRLMNAGDLPEIDPYEEVAQQGQVPPLSPAYLPDPIELEDYVPIYIPEPEHPEYHVPSDDDIQVEGTAVYAIRSRLLELEPEEDPSEEHKPKDDDEDLEEDPNEENKPKDEDTKEKEPSEGSDETEPLEEDETTITSPPPRHV